MADELFGNNPGMGTRRTLVLAVALIVTGTIGLAVVWALFGSPSSPLAGSAYASNGQRIYYTGAGASGPIPRTIAGLGMSGFGIMGDAVCVDCHGEDGRGGRFGMMMGIVEVPDIRYSALTSAHSEGGASVPGWTDPDIARAIRDGIEPDGQRLKSPMPRWDMSDADIDDVIGYLKELDAR